MTSPGHTPVEPTPRPWYAQEFKYADSISILKRVDDSSSIYIGRVPLKDGDTPMSMREEENKLGRANASHIVKCVNQHDALVKALQKAKTALFHHHDCDACQDDGICEESVKLWNEAEDAVEAALSGKVE